MTGSPLISVIVPVFNTAPYLRACLDSLAAQSYSNLEILLVDDGSTDESPAICREYVCADSRFRLISQPNTGLSAARNAGLEAAQGELIAFADSDDVVHPEGYRLLWEAMHTTGCDLVACGFVRGTQFPPLPQGTPAVLTPEQALAALLEQKAVYSMACNKLYRKSVIGSLRFPVGKTHEDEFWTWSVLETAQSVAVLDTPCYGYRMTDGSITSRRYSPRRLDGLEARALRLDRTQLPYPDLRPALWRDLRFACIEALQRSRHCATPDQRRQVRTSVKAMLRSHPLRRGDFRGATLRQRCWLVLSLLSPALTAQLKTACRGIRRALP